MVILSISVQIDLVCMVHICTRELSIELHDAQLPVVHCRTHRIMGSVNVIMIMHDDCAMIINGRSNLEPSLYPVALDTNLPYHTLSSPSRQHQSQRGQKGVSVLE